MHLGVHYQTAYRWVRDGSLAAVKYPGVGYEVTEEEVDRFATKRAIASPPPERLHVRNWHTHVAKLLDALIAGDELAARSIVDRLAQRSVSVIELCEQLIAPCLAEIGEQWHRGTVSIAEEHRATAICERTLARLATLPRGRPRGTAVVTTAQGDRHAMPSAMASLVLREDHWQTHHLGADLPIADVLSFVEEVDADLVVISLTNRDNTATAHSLTSRLRKNGRRVLVGTPGASLGSLVEQARSTSDEDFGEIS